MNREQLVALPAVVDVPTAASVLGLSRTTVYELIRVGDWPTPVLRLGKLIRLPTEPILELLGIQPAIETHTGVSRTDDAERRVG